MDSPAITLAAWSYGLTAVAYGLLVVRFWRTAGTGLRGLALVVAFGVTAAWAASNWGFVASRSPLLLAGGNGLDILRAAAWQMLLLLLMRGLGAAADDRGAYARLWPASLVLVVTALGAQLLTLAGFRSLGDPARLALFGALALSIYGLVLVEQIWRNATEDARWSIKPLCLGLVAAWLFDVYFFADALLFSRFDPDLWVARGFVHALVVPLLAVSAFRVRADVFRVRLSRRVVFHTATLVAAGGYLLFMAGAGYYVRYFGGEWGVALQVALLFGATLGLGLVVVPGSMRAKMRVFVGKHFFSYRYDYRDEWLRFTQALAATGTQPEMGMQIVRALADLVESPAGALWVRDAAGKEFVQAARWNMPADSAAEPLDSPLTSFLRDSGWVVNLEEYRSSPLRYGELELPEWLRQTAHAWLVVPLAVSGELIGFVILTTARTRLDVNWEVNDLLKTAARQAASFLGQMRATEALLEARKFDAFNRMSAFVVHDLKNIISQLSLMLKNAERHRDNPEFQKDMLETVEHSVERMKQLMMQLREGTTPVNAPQGVELAQVIARVGKAKAGQEPIPEVSIDGPVSVRGHEDRLERVIGHLVQNAQDATERTGRVWIKLARERGQALVEIGDTGQGMTPEFVRDHLFKPFQTTKQAGMGIGAYESMQYVKELGGRVVVDSTPGVGTRVTLWLPVFDAGKLGIVGAPDKPPLQRKAAA